MIDSGGNPDVSAKTARHSKETKARISIMQFDMSW
jgi:hypothetical protein